MSDPFQLLKSDSLVKAFECGRLSERRRPWTVATGADPAEARQWWSAKLWLEAQPGHARCFVQRVGEDGFWYFGPIFAPQHVSWERLRN